MSNVDSVRNSSGSTDVTMPSGNAGQGPSATDTMAVPSGTSDSGTQRATEPQNSPTDYAQTSLKQKTLDYGKLKDGNNGSSSGACSADTVRGSPYNRENPSPNGAGSISNARGVQAVKDVPCSYEASGADACATEVCGGDICGVEAKGGDICVSQVGGADACGGQYCGSDFCTVEGCGTQGCAAEAQGVSLCGLLACVTNACYARAGGANACAAEGCGGDACAAEAGAFGVCGGDACGGNTCAINTCPADACAADACAVDVVPIVPGI